MANPSTPRFTDTPVAMTVVTPRLRSQVSSDVPLKGETPDSRGQTRSVGCGANSGTISAEGVPLNMWSGLRRAAATSWQFTAVPARSGRNSAVQWMTFTPSDRAVETNRAVAGMTPTRAAASASCGKALRSPTTPRWISMVSTAVWAGRQRSARSMGIGQVYSGSGITRAPKSGRRASGSRAGRGPGATTVGLVGHAPHDVVGPPVVGLATRRPQDGIHHMELAGDLEAGDGLPAVLLNLFESGTPTGSRTDDGCHPLPPPFVDRTDHDGVEHVGVRAHG